LTLGNGVFKLFEGSEQSEKRSRKGGKRRWGIKKKDSEPEGVKINKRVLWGNCYPILGDHDPTERALTYVKKGREGNGVKKKGDRLKGRQGTAANIRPVYGGG